MEEENKCEQNKFPCLEATEKTKSNNEESPAQAPASEPAVNYNLRKFQLERVLNNNTRNKSIALLGSFPNLSDSDKAIVILEKQAFQESEVITARSSYNKNNNGEAENGNVHLVETEQPVKEENLVETSSYFCDDLNVQTQFINNIYGSYQCTPPPKLSGIKATVVYPATDKHIEKYSICQKFLINETPKLYSDITLPYITTSQFSLEWVYNILDHKQEMERIIFEDSDPDNGFILLPDLKWDGSNIETLYALAISHKRDIKSLRDLNSSHLPLLRNIRTRVAEALESRYGILSTQLRMYLHYQPSFYHLHVHINPVRNDALGIWCEKSHMLDTVINNLELLPDYYEKATIPFVLYDGNKLLELYETKINIRKTLECLADDADTGKDDKVNATIQTEEDGIVKAKKQKIAEEPIGDTIDKATAVTN